MANISNDEMNILDSDSEGPAPPDLEAPGAEEESAPSGPAQMSVKPGPDGGFEVTLKLSGTPSAEEAPADLSAAPPEQAAGEP